MDPVAQVIADQHIRLLLGWRWWIAWVGAIAGIGLALVEFRSDGGHFAADLSTYDLVAELLLYGLIVPLSTWLLLTLLAKDMARRREVESRAGRLLYFSGQLSRIQEWDELTRCLTQSFGSLLRLGHATLFIYDHRRAQLDFVTAWSTTGRLSPPSTLPHVHYDEALATPSLHTHSGPSITYLSADSPAASGQLCLPLSCSNLLVGVLLLRLRPGQILPQPDAQFVHTIAPEMALALVNGIARTREIERVRSRTQARERRRLAYELHASLTQQIGSLHFSLDRLATDNSVTENESTQRELEHMSRTSAEIYERLRDYLVILRAGDGTDLAHLISAHIARLVRNVNFQIELTTTGDTSLIPPDVSSAIYGLAQEALNNVEKYSRAALVHIDLSCSPASVILRVVDDGVGFEQADPIPSGHYGLAMMQECVDELAGTMALTSQPRRGTSLEFHIPLRPSREMVRVLD